jgi:hypothetical protein
MSHRAKRIAFINEELVLNQIIQSVKKKENWSHEQANLVEKWYRRFLILHRTYGAQTIVPHGLIDKVWHQHILDTKKYRLDCQRALGRFLHHQPFYGQIVQDELYEHVEKTNDLFSKLFNENYDDFVNQFYLPGSIKLKEKAQASSHQQTCEGYCCCS